MDTGQGKRARDKGISSAAKGLAATESARTESARTESNYPESATRASAKKSPPATAGKKTAPHPAKRSNTSQIIRASGPGFFERLKKQSLRTLRHWGYQTRLYAHRLSGRHPLQLLAAPSDPDPAFMGAESQIKAGKLHFEAHALELDAHFWFRVARSPDAYYQMAHTFNWLGHFPFHETNGSASFPSAPALSAEELVKGWMTHTKECDPRAWAADVTGKRVLNWLLAAPLILSSPDLVYRSRLLNQMARQSRHLARVLGDAPAGFPRIEAALCLLLSSYLLPVGTAWRPAALRASEAECRTFILADGGPLSRNPFEAFDCLRLLIMVRDCAADNGYDCPNFLQAAIDRLVPFLKAVHLPQTGFIRLNGCCTGSTRDASALFGASATSASALERMPHSGYQRLTDQGTILVIDTGPPPPLDLSGRAHASCGAFEMASNGESLITSMGHQNHGPLKDLLRATAAHSAAILDDRNNSPLRPDGLIGKGLDKAHLLREETGSTQSLSLTHDGYQNRLNCRLKRTLTLSDGGSRLTGCDEILQDSTRRHKKIPLITIRFHLHPSLTTRLGLAGEVIVETSGGQVWHVSSPALDLTVEESLYIDSHDKSHASTQIILSPRFDTPNPVSQAYNWEWLKVK